VHVKLDPKGRFESVTGMSPLVVDGVVTGFWRRAKGQIEVEHVVPLPVTTTVLVPPAVPAIVTPDGDKPVTDSLKVTV
jgi:hypothetical protein